MLRKLNTHTVGFISLALSAGAFAALGKLLTSPTYLVALYGAMIRAHVHQASQTDIFTIAQLVAALFSAFGGLVLAYYGRPNTIPSDNPTKPS